MLSNSRTLMRLASRQRSGHKLLGAVSQAQARTPLAQNTIDTSLHTHVAPVDRDVSNI